IKRSFCAADSSPKMISPLFYLVFFFGFFAPVDSWQRVARYVVVKGRFGCMDHSNKWIPLPGTAELWEEDENPPFYDPHDFLLEDRLDSEGRFELEGEQIEFTEVPRFFIGFWVKCQVQDKCADQLIRRHCSVKNDQGKYPLAVMVNHLFEWSPTNQLKSRYELDCALGAGNIAGLSCAGSLCGAERCNQIVKFKHPLSRSTYRY
ncbi:hypothetical protein PFISCL1PPCAC_9201, partial [Pristionchus fissidentatus]